MTAHTPQEAIDWQKLAAAFRTRARLLEDLYTPLAMFPDRQGLHAQRKLNRAGRLHRYGDAAERRAQAAVAADRELVMLADACGALR